MESQTIRSFLAGCTHPAELQAAEREVLQEAAALAALSLGELRERYKTRSLTYRNERRALKQLFRSLSYEEKLVLRTSLRRNLTSIFKIYYAIAARGLPRRSVHCSCTESKP